MYTLRHIYKKKIRHYSLLFGVYPLLLMIFWLNEFSFHPTRQVFAHLYCFIALSLIGWGSWILQYFALIRIRYNDQIKIYRFCIIIYYLMVVLLMPLLLVSILLLLKYSKMVHFYIPDKLSGIVIRLTTLSVMANLLIDIYLMSKQKYKAELKIRRMELAKQRVEMDMFKSQLNPHFLYNTLNTLCYITMQDQQKAIQYSRQFADMYGHVLKHINHDWVYLQEELAVVNNYFSLQQIRTGKQVVLDFEMDESTINQWLIAPMALQLLLENAIKHNAYCKDHLLRIIVRDTKDGYCTVSNVIRPLAEKREPSGWGLYNLVERYKLISEKPVRCYNDGKIFTVMLPLKLVS